MPKQSLAKQRPEIILEKHVKRGLMTVTLLWFLMNAGFFLIIPLLSIYYVDHLGWAAAFIGLVLAVRQFMQQGLTVFGGALADRFGAKGLIMLGVLIRAISFVIMGFATTPALLLFSGVLAALGGALFDAPTKAVVAALAPEEMLNTLYARIGILQNVARTVGPILGALLIRFDFKMVGIASAAFFLLAFFVTLVGLPAVQVSSDQQTVARSLKIVWQDRAFVVYTALMMGFWFMWVQLSIAMPLEAKALSGSDSSVSLLFAINAVIAIILQVPALRLAEKYLLPLPMLILGIILMALGLGSVALVHTSLQLYISVFFFALGSVLVVPNAQTVAATMAKPTARGAYFGVNSLALACGGGIGQIAGGTMVDLAASLHLPALPWLVSAAVGVMAAVGLTHFYRSHRASLDH
jgi:DHA1 family multidrug resistance protein-like MFS transporter